MAADTIRLENGPYIFVITDRICSFVSAKKTGNESGEAIKGGKDTVKHGVGAVRL